MLPANAVIIIFVRVLRQDICHLGCTSGITGSHRRFCSLFRCPPNPNYFHIPDSVGFEDAVLADPFSVSLHAVLKAPPEAGSLAVVYGCGTLGLLTVAILTLFYPHVEVLAITRYPHQEEMARHFGAKYTIQDLKPNEIIERVGGNRRVQRSTTPGRVSPC